MTRIGMALTAEYSYFRGDMRQPLFAPMRRLTRRYGTSLHFDVDLLSRLFRAFIAVHPNGPVIVAFAHAHGPTAGRRSAVQAQAKCRLP